VVAVVWFCVVLVGVGWCCLAGVFSGLVVDFGDDFLRFLAGRSLKVGACGQVVSGRSVTPREEAAHRPGVGVVELSAGERSTRYDLPLCDPVVGKSSIAQEIVARQ